MSPYLQRRLRDGEGVGRRQYTLVPIKSDKVQMYYWEKGNHLQEVKIGR